MYLATSDDVAFWACMVCAAVWAASSGQAYGSIFSVGWMVFGVVIRVSAKRDARHMRENKGGATGTSERV